MSSIILCNTSDVKSSVDEERSFWIFEVLEALGVPDDVFEASSIDEYRILMDRLGIEVELSTSGDVSVYKKTWLEGETEEMCGWLPIEKSNLVAQWKEPTYTKKIEGHNVYYEVQLNEWCSVRKK